MLELRSVSRSAGREAVLQQVSLTISPEAPMVLLGLSPEGRKAALRLIGGADRPDAGTILCDGRERRRQKDASVGFTWVSREGIAPSGKTAAKALRDAAAGKPGDAQAAQWLEQVGLAGKRDVKTKDLDLAQRLRLALACALAAKRSMILLDAPFRDAPADARTALLADLPAILADAGAIIVLAAAAPDEALALGGETVVFAEGRVVQWGATAEVFAHPRDLRAALATAHPCLNTLAARMDGDVCRLADGSTFHAPEALKLPLAGRCTLAFRPDDLRFKRPNDHAVRFAVRADGVETIAGRRLMRMKFADATWFAPEPETARAAGMVFSAFVDVDAIMAFDATGASVS
jgi:glycerol transport system ATP-binding protein